MPTFTIDTGGPVYVRYGYDDDPPSFTLLGVFLHVSDRRLQYDENATESVNKVSETLIVPDGGGCYLSLTTGPYGIGTRVDDSTLVTFMRRYGVPEEHIKQFPLKIDARTESRKDLLYCKACEVATTRCQRCKAVTYCGRDCQKADWDVHKLLCNEQCLPSSLPKATSRDQNSILGIFLPESSPHPRLVRVPYTFKSDEDGGFWFVDTSQYFRDLTSRIRSDWLPGFNKNNPNAYHIYFLDNFLNDGISKENACLKAMKSTQECSKNYWRGNILLMKAEPCERDPSFRDMKVQDVRYAIDALILYARGHGFC